MSWRIGLALLEAAMLPAAVRADAVTFEYIGIGCATAISAGGPVVAGNTAGDYETFRWTEETGILPLGRASVPVLGRGAGIPDISSDGTRVSGTILGADSSYITQGLWTEGEGWIETMPPLPPDGGLIGEAYGSAWDLSEVGNAVVGRNGSTARGSPSSGSTGRRRCSRIPTSSPRPASSRPTGRSSPARTSIP
jgi:hypothetical protein